jgi:hypothetical protein
VPSAALLMFSSFGGFIFGNNATTKFLGLALGFGVLVDAFIGRMSKTGTAHIRMGPSTYSDLRAKPRRPAPATCALAGRGSRVAGRGSL